MKKFSLFFVALVLIGAGCSQGITDSPNELAKDFDTYVEDKTVLSVVFPVDEYIERRTFKTFGEYIQDRFSGYHVGDDIEYVDVEEEVPVYAIADGIVDLVSWTSGYGGLMIVRHSVEGEAVTAVYGHIDLSSTELKSGDQVAKGQIIAHLGDGETQETDNERKHLHFALYQDEEVRIAGYERFADAVDLWINPQDFFMEHGLPTSVETRSFDASTEVGGDMYNLDFDIPFGWGVEYVPSLKALNLYEMLGEGDARERSQIFIRHFDASQFLTLSTVKIFERTDTVVGVEDYVARRYDIEKNVGVKNFPDQPLWRSKRHIVTDFSLNDGFTRYFVIAANPDLDLVIYEALLESMEIIE